MEGCTKDGEQGRWKSNLSNELFIFSPKVRKSHKQPWRHCRGQCGLMHEVLSGLHTCVLESVFTQKWQQTAESLSMKLLKNEHSEVVSAWRIIWRVRWQLLWSPKESGHSNVHDRVQNGDWNQGKQSGLTLQASPLYVLAFMFGGVTNSTSDL